MNYEEEIAQAIRIGLVIATFLLNIGHALKAIELCKEILVLLSNKALSIEEQLGQVIHKKIYFAMFEAYRRVNDHTNAIMYGGKLLAIYCECGDTVQEGVLSTEIPHMYTSQSMYAEAKQLLDRAIPVIRTTGKIRLEAIAYGGLGNVFQCRGEYVKAKEYYEKALAISMEIGDREGQAKCHKGLGDVFKSLGEYAKAKEYYEKALAITMEIGDRKGEETCRGSLGMLFHSLGEYVKAKEYYEKALAISMEIGDREGQGECHKNLGKLFKDVRANCFCASSLRTQTRMPRHT